MVTSAHVGPKTAQAVFSRIIPAIRLKFGYAYSIRVFYKSQPY